MTPPQRPTALDKCVRCSLPIEDGDLVVFLHGDLFHQTCWQLTTTASRIAESRTLKRRSRQLIKDSREQMMSQRRRQTGSVVCVRCDGEIASHDDYAVSARGPVHRTPCPSDRRR